LQPNQSKAHQLKLEDDEEKQLRQLLKVYDDSEVLYRIFKLFNLFYDKFSQEKEANKDEMQLEVIQTSQSKPDDVIQFVRSTYESDDLKIFVSSVSDVLKVIFKTGIEPNEGVSNLIFCVLSSFYPELFDSIKVEEEQKAKEKKELEEQKGEKTKYLVKMIPVQ
jgi:endo-1,4-beta-D-glucanase Y